MSPKPPTVEEPPASWAHHALYRHVKDALLALPAYFKTEIAISGILATDLHTLNSVLGAAIEEQVVTTLNAMRSTWDSDEKYALYSFVRQPQTFPDVLLRRATEHTGAADVLMGIELKGWYLLAKEGMPNFRMTATPAACNVHDLLVVVPWVLSHVISGQPLAFTPYITPVRYAAEYRNYHWEHIRAARGSRTGITSPSGAKPYPEKRESIDDQPEYDGGNNFGRFARTHLMDPYIESMQDRLLCGIRMRHWLGFFTSFQQDASEADTRAALDKLASEASKFAKRDAVSGEALARIIDGLRTLILKDD